MQSALITRLKKNRTMTLKERIGEKLAKRGISFSVSSRGWRLCRSELKGSWFGARQVADLFDLACWFLCMGAFWVSSGINQTLSSSSQDIKATFSCSTWLLPRRHDRYMDVWTQVVKTRSTTTKLNGEMGRGKGNEKNIKTTVRMCDKTDFFPVSNEV